MQAYGDKDRARAAEEGDHRRALFIPADEQDLILHGTRTGRIPADDTRLPSHGRHYNEGIHLEPSRDYQGEFVLHLDDAGNGGLRVQLDVGDLAALRAALPGRQGATAAEVRDFLRGLHDSCEKNPGPGGDVREAHKNLAAVVRVISMLGEA
jgi:hypothetical protein